VKTQENLKIKAQDRFGAFIQSYEKVVILWRIT